MEIGNDQLSEAVTLESLEFLLHFLSFQLSIGILVFSDWYLAMFLPKKLATLLILF